MLIKNYFMGKARILNIGIFLIVLALPGCGTDQITWVDSGSIYSLTPGVFMMEKRKEGDNVRIRPSKVFFMGKEVSTNNLPSLISDTDQIALHLLNSLITILSNKEALSEMEKIWYPMRPAAIASIVTGDYFHAFLFSDDTRPPECIKDDEWKNILIKMPSGYRLAFLVRHDKTILYIHIEIKKEGTACISIDYCSKEKCNQLKWQAKL